jgi:hypothetical protein
VFIRQLDDGGILLVRNRPLPPSLQGVPGKSALIDALAGPPPPGLVEFENFAPDTVRSIADSIDLMRPGASRTSGWGRGFASLFRAAPREGPRARFLVFDRNRRSEILEVSEHPNAHAALASRVDPRTATARTPTDAEWVNAFGADASGPGARTLVDFRPSANGTSQALGVLIRNAPADVSARLLVWIRTWLGRQPATAAHVSDVVLNLRQAIREELTGPNVREVEFYFSTGAHAIRVADFQVQGTRRRAG